MDTHSSNVFVKLIIERDGMHSFPPEHDLQVLIKSEIIGTFSSLSVSSKALGCNCLFSSDASSKGGWLYGNTNI